MAVALRPTSRVREVGLGIIGVLTVLIAWQLIGTSELFGDTWPPLTDVLSQLTDSDRIDLYRRALSVTVTEAATGYVIGSAAAITFAVGSSLVAWAERSASRFAVLVEAIPIIALGPLFITTLERDMTPVAIATIAVFFTTFVATTAGLASTPPEGIDLFRVLGAGRFAVLGRVRIPHALPSIVEGLKLGGPAAVLGAIVGEWFGTESGVGPLLISSMQNQRIPQLWAAGVVAAIPSMIIYGVMSAVHKATVKRFGEL